MIGRLDVDLQGQVEESSLHKMESYQNFKEINNWVKSIVLGN